MKNNMRKILILVAFVFALITLKQDNTVHAKVYEYWQGFNIQKNYQHASPKPNVNYSGFYCSLNDNTLSDYNHTSNVCHERGVLEFVKGKTHKIWVGFQHGKQDMFFDNKKEALAYVFKTRQNKAHWARNVSNQLVYFNAYGLQYGTKGNQRHQKYGVTRYGYLKAPNGKMMFQNNYYFVANDFRKVKGQEKYFGTDGLMKKRVLVKVKGHLFYVNSSSMKLKNKDLTIKGIKYHFDKNGYGKKI